MSSKCPRCGDFSGADLLAEVVQPFLVERHWLCRNGHEFETVEAPATMLAATSQREHALGTIHKRIARWARDQEIKAKYASGRSVSQLALQFNLTQARISQILK